jgi:hypothetical protein
MRFREWGLAKRHILIVWIFNVSFYFFNSLPRDAGNKFNDLSVSVPNAVPAEPKGLPGCLRKPIVVVNLCRNYKHLGSILNLASVRVANGHVDEAARNPLTGWKNFGRIPQTPASANIASIRYVDRLAISRYHYIFGLQASSIDNGDKKKRGTSIESCTACGEIGAFGNLKTFSGSSVSRERLISNDGSEPGINYYHHEADNLQHEAYFVAGFLCFFFGIFLLSYFYRALYFNLTPNVNVAGHVAFLLVSFIVIWIGMWLAATGLGVFTHV